MADHFNVLDTPHEHSGTYVPVNETERSPFLIVPPASGGVSTAITHQVANRAFGMKFHVPQARAYRYARFLIGVQSGNIQVAVVRRDAGSLVNFTRVMNSGIIACPAAAAIRLDLTSTVLQPGDHWLCFWADNTTITIPALDRGTGGAALGYAARLNSSVGGIGGTGTWDTADGGWVVSIALEATTP